MERALVKSLAQALQSDWLDEMLFDVAADFLDAVRLWVAAQRLRAAAQAGAVAGTLRLFGAREELNVLPAGTARGTRRPAIDACARDGEDELAVVGGVAGDDCAPKLVVNRVCGFRLQNGHVVLNVHSEYGIGSHGRESLCLVDCSG